MKEAFVRELLELSKIELSDEYCSGDCLDCDACNQERWCVLNMMCYEWLHYNEMKDTEGDHYAFGEFTRRFNKADSELTKLVKELGLARN